MKKPSLGTTLDGLSNLYFSSSLVMNMTSSESTNYYHRGKPCHWEHTTCWTEYLFYKAGTKLTRLNIDGAEFTAEGHLSRSEVINWIELIFPAR
jgi:hypothetical protein